MKRSMFLHRLRSWVCLVLLLAGCSPAKPRIPQILAEIPVEPGHPVNVATAPRSGYVYITTRHSNQVYVLQGKELVTTLQTGGLAANAIAVDEDRGWIYVANQNTDNVTVIRDTTVYTTVALAGRSRQKIAIAPQTGWAYITSAYSKLPPDGKTTIREGNVTVISGTQTIGSIFLGDMLVYDVVADPINDYVYVGAGVAHEGSLSSGHIVVIDGLEVVETIDLPAGFSIMDVDPRNGDVYVLTTGTDLLQFRGTEIIQQANFYKPNGSPRNMRIHPQSGDVYISYICGLLIVRKMELIGDLDVGCNCEK